MHHVCAQVGVAAPVRCGAPIPGRLVAANGHPVMPGVTDAELAQILDLESGRAPHMVFERPCAA